MGKQNIFSSIIRAGSVMFFSLIFTLVCSSGVFAQLRDYSLHPENPFNYQHLNLQLELDVKQGVVKGEAIYDIAPLVNGVKSMVLQANRIDIHSVWVDGKQIHFDLKKDSLIIALPKTYSAHKTFHLKIIYEAQPIFGLNRDAKDTYWTSLLPMTASHIFPVFDNPGVAVTTNIKLIVPIDYTTVSNGVLASTKAIRSGWKEDIWQSKTPIPVTDISFAVGKFDHSETLAGTKKIHLFTEKGLLSPNQNTELLNKVSQELQNVQNYLKTEYPWPALNLVVLSNDHWEQKSSAASYAYVYVNRGNIDDQVERDIYSQWFGAYQRSEQYAGAAGQIMMQAWLQWSLNHKIQAEKIHRDTLLNKPVFYNLYDVQNWLRWQNYFKDEHDSLFTQVINQTYEPLIQQHQGVLNWEDYARFWYKHSGYWFDKPELPRATSNSKLVYQFQYKYDAVNGHLTVYVDTLKGHSNELITLPLLQYNGGIKKSELTFSGVGDTLNIKAKPGLLNVNVEVPDSMNIEVIQKKPISFWFYQLRKGTNADERAEAALGLGDHTGDPDLQLALVDNMNKENSPAVKAAIITSLAKITQGATGTDQLFTGAMNTKNDTVRMAIINALRNYPGDGNAILAIRGLIQRSDNPNIVKSSIWTLQTIDHKGFPDFARSMVQRDSNFVYTTVLMKTLAKNGDTTMVRNMASHFLEPGYPYAVRVTSLRFLEQLVKSDSENWKHWIAMMVQDNDPRIRYLGWGLVHKLSKADADKLFTELAPEENDLRVLSRIKSMEQLQ